MLLAGCDVTNHMSVMRPSHYIFVMQERSNSFYFSVDVFLFFRDQESFKLLKCCRNRVVPILHINCRRKCFTFNIGHYSL